jgi:hypothetical protein
MLRSNVERPWQSGISWREKRQCLLLMYQSAQHPHLTGICRTVVTRRSWCQPTRGDASKGTGMNERTLCPRELVWNSHFSVMFVISGPFYYVCSYTRAKYGSDRAPQACASLSAKQIIEKTYFEYISIIKCLIMQFLNLNSFNRWLTRFYDGCICVYSILTSWPDREVPPQSA